MFPVDPGADATIGGMAATRASGTTAVRYGTMRENVLGLTVVLADGRVIHTGGRARKSSSGLRPHAAVRRLGRHARRDHRSHAAAVRPARSGERRGVPVRSRWRARPTPSSRRFSSASRSRASRSSTSSSSSSSTATRRPTIRWRRRCSSSFTASARPRWTSRRERSRRSRASNGALGFRWASTPEERATLWQARHNVLYATIASRPGAKPWTTDVCVPISRLAECILETQDDLRRSNIVAPLVGHAGDGNFHLIFMVDPDDADGDGRGQGRQRAAGRARAAAGRHLHRRARRRHRQAEVSGAGTRRVARRDARDQARARSRRHR